MALLNTPFVIIFLGLLIFGAAYFVYSRFVDRRIWQTDPTRPTPAHVYADGVEYFPVGRYVLYGFQFNSIAALGPILGPGIALLFGWVPAFLWIIGAALFIGWVQDYSALMLSVRNEGRSFGPIAYMLIGPRARSLLLGFLLFYFLLITAAFIFVVIVIIDAFPGTFWALLVLVLAALLTGYLIFDLRWNVVTVTGIVIAVLALGVIIGTQLQWPPTGALGEAPYTLWIVPVIILLAAGALLPLPRLITPMNYIAYYPVIVAILSLAIAGILSPLTGVEIKQPAFTKFFDFEDPRFFRAGPLWPALFVSIACGAISGWHSLVSTGLTSKQLDVETDARPVGAGAMLTENLVGLTALAAWVVLAPELNPRVSPKFFVDGAVTLTAPLFGGEPVKPFLQSFFAIYMVFMAMTILTILGRFWRVVSAELFAESKYPFVRVFGNKYVATLTGFVLPTIFVLTGSWINIWLYFGGTNQLLAGFALLIVAVYLLRIGRSYTYSLIPGIFMMVTTLAAIAWQANVFFNAATKGQFLHPTQSILAENVGMWAVTFVNAFSVIIGVIMFVLGVWMFYLLMKAIIIGRRAGEARPTPEAGAPGTPGR